VHAQGVFQSQAGGQLAHMVQHETVAAPGAVRHLEILHRAVVSGIEVQLRHRVADPGQFEAMGIGDEPGELEETVGSILLLAAPVGQGAHGLDVLEVQAQQLAIEGPEEEEAILDQGAGNRDTPRSGIGGAFIREIALPRIGTAVEAPPDAATEQRALERIAAALGDHGKDAAGGEGDLGLVAAGSESLALQDLRAQIHAKPAVGAEVGGHAIHQERIGIQHGAQYHGFGLARGGDARGQVAVLHVALGAEGQTLEVRRVEGSLHGKAAGLRSQR